MKLLEKLAPHDATIAGALAALARLRAIDAALRGDGLRIEPIAEQLGVSARTIKRDVVTLRHVVGPTRFNKVGDAYQHQYAGKHPRIFYGESFR